MDSKTIRLINLETLVAQEDKASTFAEKIGMSASQLSQIRNPKYKRTVGDAAARSIETALGLPHGWMDVLHDKASPAQLALQEETLPDEAMPLPKRRLAPVVSYVQAGDWGSLVDAYSVGDGQEMIQIDDRWSPNTFVLRVRGDSMHPTLQENAYIVVDPLIQWHHGSIVVVRQNGDTEVTVKRLQKDGDTWYLKPDNSNYKPLEMLPDAHICGVVVQQIVQFI